MADNRVRITLVADGQDAEAAFSQLNRKMEATQREAGQTQRSMRDLDSSVASVASTVKNVGLVVGTVAGTMAYFGKQALAATAELQKQSEMAGISVEAFQELQHVAAEYRISQDALTDAMKELNMRADEWVQTGAGPAAEAFERLGFSQAELNNQLHDAPALLQEVVDRLEDLDTAAQIRIADEIFGGQGGEQFKALINGGADAIGNLRDEAHKLGLVMEEDLVAQAAEANEEIDLLWRVVKTQFTVALADLAPHISTVASGLASIASNAGKASSAIRDFIDETNQGGATFQGRDLGYGYGRKSDGEYVWSKGQGAPLLPGGLTTDFVRRSMQANNAFWNQAGSSEVGGGGSLPLPGGGSGGGSSGVGNTADEGPNWITYDYQDFKDRRSYRGSGMTDWSIREARRDRAGEWDRITTAPFGIGQPLVGEDDLEMMKRFKATGEETFNALENAVSGWGNDFSHTLTDMILDADASFSDIAASFGRMITEMMIQTQVVQPMMNSLFSFGGSGGGGGGLFGGILGGITSLFGFDQGGVLDAQGLERYRNSVVSEPTIFPMAKGYGLMGESGPEAVMPLTRTSGGDLGVRTESRSDQPAVNNTFHVHIHAIDSKSLQETMNRNPNAVLGPFKKAMERGDMDLRNKIRGG